jgi:hypothetical protein
VDELTPDRILAAARDEPNDEIHDMVRATTNQNWCKSNRLLI